MAFCLWLCCLLSIICQVCVLLGLGVLSSMDSCGGFYCHLIMLSGPLGTVRGWEHTVARFMFGYWGWSLGELISLVWRWTKSHPKAGIPISKACLSVIPVRRNQCPLYETFAYKHAQLHYFGAPQEALPWGWSFSGHLITAYVYF